MTTDTIRHVTKNWDTVLHKRFYVVVELNKENCECNGFSEKEIVTSIVTLV